MWLRPANGAEYIRRVPRFLSGDEVEALRRLVRRRDDLFYDARGRGGLGPHCRLIRGERVREHLPEIVALGQERIRPAVEEFAGQALRTPSVDRRAVRVLEYRNRRDSFRWHFDINSFAALLSLSNTLGGRTELISSGLSRALRPFHYALYWAPQVFSVLPARRIELEPGDLLLLRGRDVLHRAVASQDEGERLIVAFGYEELDRPPGSVRDRVAAFLNYGE